MSRGFLSKTTSESFQKIQSKTSGEESFFSKVVSFKKMIDWHDLYDLQRNTEGLYSCLIWYQLL